MDKLDIKLEREKNDYFREWIIEEWKHHNTVDPIYQLRIIKPEELTFEENEEYYKIMFKNEMVGFIGIKNYKKEIQKIPFLSWWMYFVNCIFLDRKDPRKGLQSVLDAADMIKNGISVFLFPEGTRSKDCKLGEFKDGGFKIATKSKCPIIPVGIQGTYNVFERQFPRIKSSKVIVNFGKPIYTEPMDRSETKQLPETVKAMIKELSNQ